MEKFQEFLMQQFNKLDNRLDAIEAKVDQIDNSEIRMENEITDKIRSLYDAREVQSEVNERIISTLDRLEAKLYYS